VRPALPSTALPHDHGASLLQYVHLHHVHSCSAGCSKAAVLICAAVTLGAAQRGAITASSVLGCLHLSKLEPGEVDPKSGTPYSHPNPH